jgi:hypothetical protein
MTRVALIDDHESVRLGLEAACARAQKVVVFSGSSVTGYLDWRAFSGAAPADVDLERRVWIPRDGKGGWGPGVYLNDDMLEAWKLFAAVDAWGPFDSGSFAERIRAAGLPPALTPYQLRHTVGIALSEAGIDLQDISQHMGHKRTDTTRRHYVPVLASRLQRASEALNDRKLGWKATETTDEDVSPSSDPVRKS